MPESHSFLSSGGDSTRPVALGGTGEGARPHTRFAHLLGEEIVEGSYGGEFVVFDVEDGVELGDVEDVLDFLGEVEEFEFAAGVADGGGAADELSDAGAVDVVDAFEAAEDGDVRDFARFDG